MYQINVQDDWFKRASEKIKQGIEDKKVHPEKYWTGETKTDHGSIVRDYTNRDLTYAEQQLYKQYKSILNNQWDDVAPQGILFTDYQKGSKEFYAEKLGKKAGDLTYDDIFTIVYNPESKKDASGKDLMGYNERTITQAVGDAFKGTTNDIIKPAIKEGTKAVVKGAVDVISDIIPDDVKAITYFIGFLGVIYVLKSL